MQKAYCAESSISQLWTFKRGFDKRLYRKGKKKRDRRNRKSWKMGQQASSNKMEKKDKINKENKYNVHMFSMQEKRLAERGHKNIKNTTGIAWKKFQKLNF